MISIPSPPFPLPPPIYPLPPCMANADKRVALGSDKPSEGVATSLRFPSQPGSFSPGNYESEASGSPDGQPESPIKTSPVSERIKALEALAAKKSEPDNRNNGTFLHFKERHYEKSPTEALMEANPIIQKEGGSTDQESPESPFEVLGDSRHSSEFEDTAEWMRAHLPPVPDFDDTLDLRKDSFVSEKINKSNEMKGADVVIPDVPEAFAGVPDAFMDSPVEAPKMKDYDSAKQPSVEGESEFDVSFLPTAYMWDKQKKPDTQTLPPDLDSELPVPPAPPVGFDSPVPPPSPPAATDSKQKVPETKKTPWAADLEPPEVAEVDSSGESDDTVIEDAVAIPPTSIPSSTYTTPASAPAPSPPSSSAFSTEKSQPVKQEKQPLQVPIINVIETDEPNYSDEEMEMEMEVEEDENYEVVKNQIKEAPKTPEPQPNLIKSEPSKIPPLESEFMEGYSPSSSPVDSDPEYSPQHKILKSGSDQTARQSSVDELQDVTASKSPSSDASQAQPDKAITLKESIETYPPFIAKPPHKSEDVDFSDNDDEWADDVQEGFAKSDLAKVAHDLPQSTTSTMDKKPDSDMKQDYMETVAPLTSSLMQDDMTAGYDRQSFDDYDAPPGFNDYDTVAEPSDPTSQIQIETLKCSPERAKEIRDLEAINSINEEDSSVQPVGGQPSHREFPKDPYSSFQSEPKIGVKEPMFDMKDNNDTIADDMVNSETLPLHKIDPKTQKDSNVGHHSPDMISDPESIEPECSVSAATDSFVDFMRECLKSRQDEEPEDLCQGLTSKNELQKTGASPSQNPPTMVMDLEQEHLTISALKELGSRQENKEDLQALTASNLDKSQSSLTSNPNPLSPQTKPASDSSSYSKEVEAIDEWVAEAYHLAEHVLTAILTHLSGKMSSLWALCLLTFHTSTAQRPHSTLILSLNPFLPPLGVLF